MERWKHAIAYVLLAVGFIVAVMVSFGADHRDIARNCHSGQRSWDTLSAVVHTAYESRSLSIDPATLPPDTRKLLVALAPLLKASAGSGHQTEHAVLEQLGARPSC